MTIQKAKLFLMTLLHTIDGFSNQSDVPLSTEPMAAPELRADNHRDGVWLCGRSAVVTDVGSGVTNPS